MPKKKRNIPKNTGKKMRKGKRRQGKYATEEMGRGKLYKKINVKKDTCRPRQSENKCTEK